VKSFSAGVNKVIKTLNALMLKLFLNIYYENQRYGFKSITTIVTIVITIIIFNRHRQLQCMRASMSTAAATTTTIEKYTQQSIYTTLHYDISNGNYDTRG